MNLTADHARLASKAGAILVLSVGLLAGFFVLIYPVATTALLHRSDMTALRARLTQIEVEAARIPALKQHLADITSAIASEDAFWPGDTDNAVSIAIQTRVRQLLQSAGVNLTRLDSVEAQSGSGFRRHTVRTAFSGDDKEFVDVLVALARQRPHLRIDSLSVRGHEINRPPDRGDPVFATLLNVELELSGLGKGAGPDGDPP